MYGLSINRHRTLAVFVVALLCLSLLLPIGISAEAGGSPENAAAAVDGARGIPIDDATAIDGVSTAYPDSSEATSTHAASSQVRIDPALENATGVVEAIVRFESDGTRYTSTVESSAGSLRTAADRSQRTLERAAETTDGLTVERGFWLANAALVTVDTDRVDLATVGAIEGVAEIHENAAVALASTETVPAASADATGVPGTGNATVASGTSEATVPSRGADTTVADPAATATATRFGDSYTYGLEQLSVPEARDRYRARGAGATVAVLDTGVDASHPDIRVDEWRDFSGGSSTPIDYDRHGTHVAGTVVGGDASGTQIGVAPDARLLAGAVLTDCDGGTCVGPTSDVIAGMEWAVESGADVISLSLGSEGYTSTYLRAVRNAEAGGTVVVAGAGNGGDGVSASPGNIYDVISVGATNRWERVPDFSSGEVIDTDDAWGWRAPSSWPDSYVVPTLVAPGDRILSTVPGGGYERKRGTSMATPHVAGVIALLQGATERTLEPDEIRAALIDTAAFPSDATDGQNTRFGHGIVDAAAALEEAGSFGTLEGSVTDRVTDAPITEATVTAEADDGTVFETTTDSRGRYELAGLEGDREYAVTVAASHYDETTESTFVPADETTTGDVSLAGDGELEVIVDDAHFGDRVAEATVTATSHRGTYPATRASEGEREGVYVVEDVPSDGKYTVTAAATGYATERTKVTLTAGGESVTERLELSGDATLEVAVEDRVTTAAVANASVTVERPDGTAFDVGEPTDGDGTVAVTVPGTGDEYTVRADGEGYETGAATVDVSSNETAPVDLPLTGDGELEVVVDDAHFGNGVTEATVTATGRQGTYSATHEGDGVYLLDGVPSRGEYAVDVSGEGYVDANVSMGFDPDDPTSERVSLVGDATVAVTVVDEDDDPLENAIITVERPDGTSFEATGRTDADGKLSVTVPGDGTAYAVTADADGYEPTAETTTGVSSGGTESVTVALSPAEDGLPGFGAVAAVLAVVALLLVRARR